MSRNPPSIRRRFLKIGLNGLGAALALFGFQKTFAGEKDSPAKKKWLALPLAKLAGLAKIGGGTTLKLKERQVVFIRISETEVSALDTECSHKQCPVFFEKEWGELRCECHGSTFSTKGEVQNGPADANLTRYPAKIQGENLLVFLVRDVESIRQKGQNSKESK